MTTRLLFVTALLSSLCVATEAGPWNLPATAITLLRGGENADYDDAASIADAAKDNMKEGNDGNEDDAKDNMKEGNDGNDDDNSDKEEEEEEDEDEPVVKEVVEEEVVEVVEEMPTPSSPSEIPRGGSDYAAQLEGVKSDVIAQAYPEIKNLQKTIVDEGRVVPQYGTKADTLVNQALQEFATRAPDAGDDVAMAATYDRKLGELEDALDAPLQVLYLKQLALLRETALQGYRTAAKTSGASDYESMLVADGKFARDAADATREGSDWDYALERAYLQQAMNSIAESSKKSTEIQLKSSQQSQTAMQFLQQQQQMIQQLQMQLYGQASPWNVGVAYRIPDTNFNLQGSYQQGRANVQLSCVPDEYAPMLGPNGFTNGVGPGNLGLSLNLSV